MSINQELSEIFDRVAVALKLLEANRFRVLAYERGARALEEMGRDVREIAGSVKELTAVDGIGKGLAEKIKEYIDTGRMVEVEETLAQVPDTVLGLVNIPGVGPKTALTLWKQGGIESVADLKAQLDSGELENLPRLGKKTLENIRKSITFAESAGGRIRMGVALDIALPFVRALEKLDGVTQVDYAGSLRRGRETIGDVDILVGCEDPETHGETIGATFRDQPGVTEVLLGGSTKSSVRVESGVQVDLRVVPASRYGAALLYFTGSKAHNVALREWAIRKHELHLNEYGLWTAEDFREGKGRPVAAKTEARIYEKLGLTYVPPEMREDRGELALAQEGTVPTLVEVESIQSELHVRNAGGSWSLEDVRKAARQRGLHTVAITNPAADGAPDVAAIRAASDGDVEILAGAEVQILPDGQLDTPDEILATLDFVVAVPVEALDQKTEDATQRLVRAIEHPHVHLIGHPTGRRIGTVEGLSPDWSTVFAAAASAGTALEICARDDRLDLGDVNARTALDSGVLLSINAMPERESDLDQLIYGVLTARRAWAQPEQVINCWTAERLREWIASRGA